MGWPLLVAALVKEKGRPLALPLQVREKGQGRELHSTRRKARIGALTEETAGLQFDQLMNFRIDTTARC